MGPSGGGGGYQLVKVFKSRTGASEAGIAEGSCIVWVAGVV
jgi:hypothetical protein